MTDHRCSVYRIPRGQRWMWAWWCDGPECHASSRYGDETLTWQIAMNEAATHLRDEEDSRLWSRELRKHEITETEAEIRARTLREMADELQAVDENRQFWLCVANLRSRAASIEQAIDAMSSKART